MTTDAARRNGGSTPASRGLLPVASVSRRDAVMIEIRRAIVIGALKPGDKLTEVSLAQSLNVSRPTVREALTQIAGEGLLVAEPYKGLRIADMTPRARMDIARTRVALDLLAATAILDDASGRRLEVVLDGWRDYEDLEFDPDPVVRHEAHLTFHRTIWVASENETLLRLWPVIEAQITIALAQDQALRPDGERVRNLHKLLVDAFLTHDLAMVEAAFVKHTIGSAQELIVLLDEAGA